jgi:hypothetical protein
VSTSGYASLIVSGDAVRMYRVTAIDGFASQVTASGWWGGASRNRISDNVDCDA